MLNLEKIGNKITELRKENHMKQNELAEALYVTHQAVSKWENGKSIPSIEILYDLTKLFKVSIDYLLDDSEILDSDYESQLKNFPRESVISKFLHKDNLNNEVEKIFYLLTKAERKEILNKIMTKTVKIEIKNLWHILSKEERWYLLNIIISGKFKYDINEIFSQFNDLERQLAKKHYIFIRKRNRSSLILEER
ncbi:helix-turn-helix domain-containing protein [Candidatus Izemoplasma sp. B36]|uniref:helix-turn-helix domain-containing protein n=1 Tax=Candidatus Izemoplasma sp. B36 TaxID=3242468 RepID=UPI0035571418